MYSNSTSADGYTAAFARFLKTVFNYMAGGVALSGVVAYLTFNNAQLLAAASNPVTQIIFFVIWFGFGFFAHKIIRKVPAAVGLMLFAGFSAITGFAMTPIVAQYTGANITTAFFIASAIFAGMSMFGISTKKSLSGWGSFISMASIGLIAAIVIMFVLTLFGVNTSMMSIILSLLIVPLVSAGIAYEVNMLRDMFHEFGACEDTTSEIAITSAVSLYTSFVVLFLNILQLLGFFGGDE
jgi:FtsH-binding integral membrane protein